MSEDALLSCTQCGAHLEVTAKSAVIAEEAFFHRRHFHQELLELDFMTRLPSEVRISTLTVSAGKLAADQSQRLLEWDSTIADLAAA
jgi:hypothetical protein